MDFVDEVTIQVSSGKGGDGIVAFRREKFVPRGGPNGGDGGYGGDVVIEADNNLNTLVELRYKTHYKAADGGRGGPNDQRGSDQPPLIIKVPVGTLVFNCDENRYIADFTYHGQTYVVAKGGRGGRGNAAFATSVEQAPKYAEKGEPGETAKLKLELKLLADVGVIGFPSVGKSTLISQVSNSKPKIADYPFTTLVPNLGVVSVSPTESFVMADVPGLIEGASEGAGLGHRFLKHIERTRVLIHLLDCSPYTARDPFEDYLIIRNELKKYSNSIASLPEIIGLNKVDIPEAKERAQKVETQLCDYFQEISLESPKIRLVSTATGEGVKQLVWDAAKLLREAPKQSAMADHSVVRIEGPKIPFTIDRGESGEYIVRGKEPETLVAMTDLNNEKTLRRLQIRLEKLGVLKALRNSGIKDGDTVKIGLLEFDWFDENAIDGDITAV